MPAPFIFCRSAKDKIIQSSRLKTGLEFIQIESRSQLQKLLDSGLEKLYKDVFAGAPYFEKFTDEEVKKEFEDFLNNKGIVIIASDAAQKSRPVAFVASVPLKTRFDLVALAKDKMDVNKAGYFAEDGVAENYRRRGLSQCMKQLLLEANREVGLPQMLLRTSSDNYPQISAVNKAGGRVLKGVFQEVARKRIDGSTTIEKSAFYLFDEKTQRLQPNLLGDVLVLREDGKDKALVMSQIPQEKQNDMRNKIQDIYPAISSVSFASDSVIDLKGDRVFNGRMYSV